MTGLQIGHYHRKRSKPKSEKKKRCVLNSSVQFDDCSEGEFLLRYSSPFLSGVLHPLLSAFGKVGVLTDYYKTALISSKSGLFCNFSGHFAFQGSDEGQREKERRSCSFYSKRLGAPDISQPVKTGSDPFLTHTGKP